LRVLITGGGGFLGQAIGSQLLAEGYEVFSVSRNIHPTLEKKGIIHFQAALTDYPALLRAFSGMDAIIHTAAKAGVWGKFQEYYAANVVGTENVLRACQQLGIQKLVYTSTPSVAFSGKSIEGLSEVDLPYATSCLIPYTETKILAEKKILSANTEQLATVALRPHLIWGENDPHFMPRLLARHRAGQLFALKNCNYLIDHVYIENAALAHVLALKELCGTARCSGKAYFITQGEPIGVFTWLNKLSMALGYEPIHKQIPQPLAYSIACVVESIYRILNIKNEPFVTRFIIKQLSHSHWFDISAAKRDFNYVPRFTTDQALLRFAQYYKTL
jgi:nucleoside-diphosphate-sugar epimerase